MRIIDTPFAHLASGGRVVAPDNGGARALAAGLGDAGDKIFQMALNWQNQQDHDALVEAQAMYSKANTEYEQERDQSRTGSNARGVAQEWGAKHKDMGDAVSKEVKSRMSGNGREAFRQWLTGREAAGFEQAARFEHGQMQLHAQDMHTTRVQGIIDSLGNDPTKFKDAFDQLEEAYTLAVGQGVYRPEEAKARLHDMQGKLRGEAFENLYAANRGLAMKSLDALGLNTAEKARAQKRYQADVRHEAAVARAENAERGRALMPQIKDAEYVAAQTGNVTGLRNLAKQFAGLGDTEKAEALTKAAEVYEDNYDLVKDSNALPLPELGAILLEDEQLFETQKTLGGDVTTQADTLRETENRFTLRAKVYEARVKALQADPAKAVNVTPKEGDTPETLARLRLAAQEKDGLAVNSRKVFTKDEAAHMTALWQTGDMQARIAVAAELKAYGPYAGMAANEVGLSPAEQLALISSRNSVSGAVALSTIITASATPLDKLPKIEGAETLARDAVNASAAIAGYRAMAEVMPGNANLWSNLKNLEETAGKLVRMTHGDANRAAQMMDGTLQSLTRGNFALVYDASQVSKDSLQNALEDAQEGRLAEFAKGRKDSEEGRKAWLTHMRNRGRWINAPDGDGYIFIDPVAQVPVTDSKGQTFRLRMSEVKK